MTTDKPQTVDDRLSAELGIDVTAVEQQAMFHLDLLRMQHGETAELGYVLMNREHHPNAAIVFPTPEEARRALNGHPLIENLCEEDRIDARVPDQLTLSDLASREVILP
ncbi:hypothetical protein ACFVVC_02115 [Pseudarthrobacter sp. NPDC058196]|uniref:hypothetical protein n=1 Tax=Pseudarthrobacter sp. NPDC058196 TaxID=3346376 RepID=UPI0036DBE473